VVPQHGGLTLAFPDERDEAAFTQWHATNMWRFDAAGLLLCALLQTATLLLPCMRRGLLGAAPWPHWALGYCHLAPLAMLTTRRPRRWYLRHRDVVLLILLGALGAYQHRVVSAYAQRGAAATGPSLLALAYSFLWLPAAALLFELRFAHLAPALAAALAGQLVMLRGLCDASGGARVDGARWHCMARGAAKAAAMCFVALTTVYTVEARARRIWAASRS